MLLVAAVLAVALVVTVVNWLLVHWWGRGRAQAAGREQGGGPHAEEDLPGRVHVYLLQGTQA